MPLWRGMRLRLRETGLGYVDVIEWKAIPHLGTFFSQLEQHEMVGVLPSLVLGWG